MKPNFQSNTLLNEENREKSQLKKIKSIGLNCQVRNPGHETDNPIKSKSNIKVLVIKVMRTR